MAKKARQWAVDGESREERDVPIVTDEEIQTGLLPWEDREGAAEATAERRSWINRWRGLQDAIVTTEEGHPVLLVGVGDTVLIERYSSELGGRYLDTRLYTIHSYDPMQGDLRLWDNEGQQWAGSNVIAGILRGVTRFWMPQ